MYTKAIGEALLSTHSVASTLLAHFKSGHAITKKTINLNKLIGSSFYENFPADPDTIPVHHYFAIPELLQEMVSQDQDALTWITALILPLLEELPWIKTLRVPQQFLFDETWLATHLEQTLEKAHEDIADTDELLITNYMTTLFANTMFHIMLTRLDKVASSFEHQESLEIAKTQLKTAKHLCHLFLTHRSFNHNCLYAILCWIYLDFNKCNSPKINDTAKGQALLPQICAGLQPLIHYDAYKDSGRIARLNGTLMQLCQTAQRTPVNISRSILQLSLDPQKSLISLLTYNDDTLIELIKIIVSKDRQRTSEDKRADTLFTWLANGLILTPQDRAFHTLLDLMFDIYHELITLKEQTEPINVIHEQHTTPTVKETIRGLLTKLLLNNNLESLLNEKLFIYFAEQIVENNEWSIALALSLSTLPQYPLEEKKRLHLDAMKRFNPYHDFVNARYNAREYLDKTVLDRIKTIFDSYLRHKAESLMANANKYKTLSTILGRKMRRLRADPAGIETKWTSSVPTRDR